MTPTNLKKASAFLNATSADICATCGFEFSNGLSLLFIHLMFVCFL